MQRGILFAILGAAATLISLGLVPKPVSVTTGKVERRTLEVTVDASGKTRIRNRYLVSAPVSGQLARIALQVGDPVTEGMVVARIAPLAPQLLDERTRGEVAARVEVADANLARTKAAVSRASTALTFAEGQAERSRRLREQGGVSQLQFETTEHELQVAGEELASARLAERVSANELSAARAALTSIRGQASNPSTEQVAVAPAGGRVLQVLQESEGAVQVGAPLVEIGDPRGLEIIVDALTSDAVGISVGAVAHIERWGGSYPLAARVQRKLPSAFTARSALGVEEQRVPVVLDIVEDPARWSALDDGYRVEARIRVTQLEGVLAVPASALFREGDGWAVFAIKHAHARKTHVEIGVRNADWAEVKQGLAVGDAVVLYPSDQVADGIDVQ